MGPKFRLWRVAILVAAVCSLGARYQTPNFVVDAPTPQIARQVAEAAERYRKELAVQWLGYALPRWYAPCHVTVHVGQMGAGGATTFSFERGSTGQMEVFGWRMTVQGPLNRILDSVLPHEVTHTILACHFRRPLPRWADEGAATLAEHASEKQKLIHRALQDLRTARRIPLRSLLAQTEYPADMSRVLTLYAEGYLLADFLVRQGGRRRYLQFLEDAHRLGWERAVRKHYGYGSIAELEQRWGHWVLAGGPSADDSLVASNQSSGTGAGPKSAAGHWDAVIRSQTPEHTRRAGSRTRPLGAVVALADRLPARSGLVPNRRPASRTEPAALASQGRTASQTAVRSSSPRGNPSLAPADGWTPFAGHTRPGYGEGLHAPDPRLASLGPSHWSPNDSGHSSLARSQPESAGWVPHSPKARPTADSAFRSVQTSSSGWAERL